MNLRVLRAEERLKFVDPFCIITVTSTLIIKNINIQTKTKREGGGGWEGYHCPSECRLILVVCASAA